MSHNDKFLAGKTLDVFLASENNLQTRQSGPFERKRLVSGDDVITNVVPSDFDGDSHMDVLVTLMREKNLAVQVFWGQRNSTSVGQ